MLWKDMFMRLWLEENAIPKQYMRYTLVFIRQAHTDMESG